MSRWPNLPRFAILLGFVICAHSAGIVALAQNQDPDPCPTCAVQEIVGPYPCGGTIECGHGPENDQADCVAVAQALVAQHPELANDPVALANLMCSEMNGGTGPCECFECGQVDTCEQFIVVTVAWCGIETENQEGSVCETHTQNINPEQRVRYSYDATIVGGGACAYNSGFERGEFCGGGGTACACLGNNSCVVVFGTYSEIKSHKFPACGPPPTG